MFKKGLNYLKSTQFLFIACCVIGIWGLFFRVYGLPMDMPFFGDQGMDLLSAARIVNGEFYPLVGPLLNLKGFFTPPTYYYFLALLLKIFQTEQIIIFVFGILNILSAILFAFFFKKRVGEKVAYLFFILYMIAWSSVEQSRMLWQPYPVAFFVSLALFLFIKAEERKKSFFWIGGLISAVIGMSLYAGAVVLFPFIVYQSSFCLREVPFLKKHNKKIFLIAFSFMTLSIAFLIINIPNIIFEIKNGFPTFVAVFHKGEQPSNTHFVFFAPFQEILSRLVTHLHAFRTMIFPSFFIIVFEKIVSCLVLIFLILTGATLKDDHYRKKWIFFFKSVGLQYLLLGFLPFIFLETGSISHRFLVFFPFVLVLFSFSVFISYRKHILLFFVNVFLLSLFIFFNYLHTVRKVFVYPSGNPTYSEVRELYFLLKSDMKLRNISFENTEIHLVTDQDTWDYEAQALWYILYQEEGYNPIFSFAGNDTLRTRTIKNESQGYYLICQVKTTPVEECIKIFSEENEGFSQDEEFLLKSSTIIYFDKDTQ